VLLLLLLSAALAAVLQRSVDWWLQDLPSLLHFCVCSARKMPATAKRAKAAAARLKASPEIHIQCPLPMLCQFVPPLLQRAGRAAIAVQVRD